MRLKRSEPDTTHLFFTSSSIQTKIKSRRLSPRHRRRGTPRALHVDRVHTHTIVFEKSLESRHRLRRSERFHNTPPADFSGCPSRVPFSAVLDRSVVHEKTWKNVQRFLRYITFCARRTIVSYKSYQTSVTPKEIFKQTDFTLAY